jgi:hypothetical protein
VCTQQYVNNTALYSGQKSAAIMAVFFLMPSVAALHAQFPFRGVHFLAAKVIIFSFVAAHAILTLHAIRLSRNIYFYD